MSVKYDFEILNESIVMTNHEDGRLKFWNLKTAEELTTFTFKSPVTSFYVNRESEKLVCFFKNNNEIKFIDLNKFNNVETYYENEFVESNRVSSNYVIQSFESNLGGRFNRWVLFKDGGLFLCDPLIKDRVSI